MKKLFVSLAMVVVAVTSCQKEYVSNDAPKQNQSVELPSSNTRSYDEALAIAEDALKLLEGDDTRSTTKRVIKRNEGQTVLRPVTRGGEVNEEPIMYVFNNEDNQGFTIIAANRAQQPLIAVTELGNYTYGEPTGVEPFDLLMDDVVSTLSITPPEIIIPDTPITPTPGYYVDTVYYRTSAVDKMLTTKWGQSGIYGAYCPNGLSGCGNTAAVQIMAYHRAPSSLLMTYDNSNALLLLDWRGMLRHFNGNGSSCACGCNYVQIGKVMREVGHKSFTNYRDDDPSTSKNERGSGTAEVDTHNTLVGLGYGHAQHIANIILAENIDVIIDNLDNKLPLYMSGYSNPSGGHAWVIDGYNRLEYKINIYVSNPDYNPSIIYNPQPEYIVGETRVADIITLHINWGWDGTCDGWFNYGNFATNDAESYDNTGINNGTNINFQRNFHLIYNIKTN